MFVIITKKHKEIKNFDIEIFTFNIIRGTIKNEQQVNIYKYLIMLNLEENDLKEISKKDKVVMKFMDELVKLNSRPEFREYMSVEEDERKIHNSLLNESYNSGMLNGIKEEKINLAKKSLLTGLDIKTISNLTDLSEEEIKKLNSRPEFREYMSVEEDERKIHNSLLQSSYNEGKKEEKLNFTKKLLLKGLDIKTISNLTDLSEEEIKKLNSRPEFREYMSKEEDERKIHNSLLQSSYNEGIIKTAINLLNENIDINIIAKVTGLSLDKIKELNKN